MSNKIKAIKLHCKKQTPPLIPIVAIDLEIMEFQAPIWTEIKQIDGTGLPLKYTTGEKLENRKLGYVDEDKSDDFFMPNAAANRLTVDYGHAASPWGEPPVELTGHIIVARCDGKPMCEQHLVTIERGLEVIKAFASGLSEMSNWNKSQLVFDKLEEKYFADLFDRLQNEAEGRQDYSWREVENSFRRGEEQARRLEEIRRGAELGGRKRVGGHR